MDLVLLILRHYHTHTKNIVIIDFARGNLEFASAHHTQATTIGQFTGGKLLCSPVSSELSCIVISW